MNEYIECTECAFVVLAKTTDDPEPRRVDACPDCGSTDFRFSSASSSDLSGDGSRTDE